MIRLLLVVLVLAAMAAPWGAARAEVAGDGCAGATAHPCGEPVPAAASASPCAAGACLAVPVLPAPPTTAPAAADRSFRLAAGAAVPPGRTPPPLLDPPIVAR